MDEETQTGPSQEASDESATSEGAEITYPVLFLPKSSDEYSVPDSGRGMVDFTKISEDEKGCTIQLTSFEPQDDGMATTEDMDAMDHVNNFITKRENEGGY